MPRWQSRPRHRILATATVGLAAGVYEQVNHLGAWLGVPPGVATRRSRNVTTPSVESGAGLVHPGRTRVRRRHPRPPAR